MAKFQKFWDEVWYTPNEFRQQFLSKTNDVNVDRAKSAFMRMINMDLVHVLFDFQQILGADARIILTQWTLWAPMQDNVEVLIKPTPYDIVLKHTVAPRDLKPYVQ